jgi:hypothetical protein
VSAAGGALIWQTGRGGKNHGEQQPSERIALSTENPHLGNVILDKSRAKGSAKQLLKETLATLVAWNF